MTPAIKKRIACLAAHADTGPGLDRLCDFVESYRYSPAQQQDGTVPWPTERRARWWDRVLRAMRGGWV